MGRSEPASIQNSEYRTAVPTSRLARDLERETAPPKPAAASRRSRSPEGSPALWMGANWRRSLPISVHLREPSKIVHGKIFELAVCNAALEVGYGCSCSVAQRAERFETRSIVGWGARSEARDACRSGGCRYYGKLNFTRPERQDRPKMMHRTTYPGCAPPRPRS
jgi:hypothetical protein